MQLVNVGFIQRLKFIEEIEGLFTAVLLLFMLIPALLSAMVYGNFITGCC